MADMADFRDEKGKVDWKALRAAEVEAGEHCYQCNAFILHSKGVRALCSSCRSLDEEQGEVRHDDWIRCPKCGHAEDIAYLDNNDIYDPNDVTDVTCDECEHEYTVETAVSYTFTSPARVCEICEGEGTLTCESCSGSGEGMADGSQCRSCKGSGEVPCECQADRLKEEADAKDAAAEAKADARRDGE